MRTILAIVCFLISTDALASEHRETRTIPGARLHIEFSEPLSAQRIKLLSDWVQASARSVAGVYGRFPVSDVRVILQPTRGWTWGSADAVTFGRVTRGGGGTVELFINADQPMAEFYADWTATHEFSHLLLPLLKREHRWVSEGFASYYQNVLMSRSGRYDYHEGWSLLAAGIARGRQSRPDLTPNEAGAAGYRDARMKYYWAGAAVALLADAELRSRSDGAESLDSVLGELQSCCLPSRRTWSAVELFKRLDRFLSEPVFMPLWDEYADSTQFPAVEAILEDPSYDAIRKQIMAKR